MICLRFYINVCSTLYVRVVRVGGLGAKRFLRRALEELKPALDEEPVTGPASHRYYNN